MKKLVAVFALLLSAPAYAVPREPQNDYKFVSASGTLVTSGVSGAALNGTPTTSEIDVRGYSVLTVAVDLVRVATTTLVLTCYGSVDGTNFDNFKTASFSSGAGTPYSEIITYPSTTATGTYIFPPLTIHYREIKCALTGASAGASDLVSVNLILGVL